MVTNQQLPAFTPVPANPVVPGKFSSNDGLANPPQPAKKARAAKKGKAKAAKKTAAAPAEKRQRRSRVAPLQMDAAQALNAIAGLSKKEVESLQAMIILLDPLPRPARQRVLTSVASILGK